LGQQVSRLGDLCVHGIFHGCPRVAKSQGVVNPDEAVALGAAGHTGLLAL